MLLNEAPDLLPGREDGRPSVVAAEFFVSVGRVDLVGVSPSGSITVVECKLQANPEIRRSIVGQLFAYASALWEMSYEEFDRAWQARTGSTLLDHMAREVQEHGLGWDRDAFRAAVADNLAAGRFTLVIAVDDITEELRRIIEYLSAHTGTDVDVVALELGYVADGDLEILVPQTYGTEMADRKSRRVWDEASFFDALLAARSPAEVAVARSLFEWAQRRMPRIGWTSGALTGSFIPGFERDGVVHNVVLINSAGRLVVLYDYMAKRRPFTDAGLRAQFAAKLAEAGFLIGDGSASGSPGVTLEAFVAEDALERLIGVLDWADDTILGASQSDGALVTGHQPADSEPLR